ncbi:hypothetical protein D7X94_01875 [Acutalibacter sp. 1XD8-33]|uniref:hypothetical protein n=1 Tax=Acutalibacter sp. 1XD8-33 TaxID=2320081 RepID=UPI000EA31E6A|nr:hypothetical protein [Acutalibacter sp. 1XD8-33]RKJ42248.1 hypothetical protein D7X94_01875 [Acutalibacter sp. 1XD8-33]
MNKPWDAGDNREGPQRRRKKLWQRILAVVGPMVLAGGLVTVCFFAMNGVPVWGAPNPKDVASVTVAWAEDPSRTYTDPEKIELAVKLINKLNYQPFTPVSEASEQVGPDVTFTYTLKDGRELTAGANWITGWWKGEARALKTPDLFVNLAEGLFPPGEG